MSLTFGKKRSEVGGGEFIRNFKDAETRIRVLEEPSEWLTYLEHWNNDIRRFHPCTEDETCIGCRSLDERTSKVSRKYVFNALDATGRVRVFQCGKKLLQKFEHRTDKWGTVLTRDVIVSRMGKGLETEYDLEGQEEAPIDLTAYELHNIPGVLSEAYNRALSVKGQGQDALPEDIIGSGNGHSSQAVDLSVFEGGGNEEFDPLSATLTDLQGFCKTNDISYKPTASRNTLVAAVQNFLG